MSIESGVGKKAKLREVKLIMEQQFDQMRGNNELVNRSKLRDIAMRVAETKGVNVMKPGKRGGNRLFKASEHFIRNFVSKTRLSSLKITERKSDATLEKEMDGSFEEKMGLFVSQSRRLSDQYNIENIFNSDQLGFTYETVPKRTYDRKCTKKVTIRIKSSNKTTHSFTVQLLISASGKLQDLYIIFKEDQPSEKVLSKLPMTPHVIYDFSKSGKMDSFRTKNWIKHVLKHNISDGKNLLFLDSYTAQKDPQLYHDIIGMERIDIQVLPPNSTQYLQPLDLRFNLQYRYVYKKIMYDATANDFDSGKRENLALVHTIVHNQFQHDKFIPLIQNSFAASELVTKSSQHSKQSVSDILFGFESLSKCHCGKYAFIQCAHCEHVLCYSHLIQEFHYHNIDV